MCGHEVGTPTLTLLDPLLTLMLYSLANAELYLTIARIVRRFDLTLYETIRERDVEVVHDGFIGMPAFDSPGIRVKVTHEYLS